HETEDCSQTASTRRTCCPARAVWVTGPAAPRRLAAGAGAAVPETVLAAPASLRGRGTQEPHRLSTGRGCVQRPEAGALREGQGAAAGTGPVPRQQPGAWPVLLGPARHQTAAVSGQHVQGTARRP